MKIQIQTTFPQVAASLERLTNDLANVVSVRAVNAMVAQARTKMSQAITAEFNLSAAKVKEKLFVARATFKGNRYTVAAELSSRVKGGGRRSINLINFAARQTKEGVSVKIRKAGGRKVIRHAFIANKGRTVFARVGSERLPIKPLQTIDVPQMFQTRRINAAVIRFINEKFPVLYERELAYALSRLAKP